MADYQYDAFFSYKRDQETDSWHLRVKDLLVFWLKQELARQQVNIFIDQADIHSGDTWRNRLGEALKTSKCLVCVWSPLYFQSKWCVSEWRTFAARESASRRNLVLPARFHDGESFPTTAREKQSKDFSPFACTLNVFWDTTKAYEFEQTRLRPFAKDLADMIRRSPPFADFPLVEAQDNEVMAEPDIGRPANA